MHQLVKLIIYLLSLFKERKKESKKESLSYCLAMQYGHICVWACVYIHKALQTLSLVLNSQTEGCLDLYKHFNWQICELSLFQPILAVKDKPQDTERITLPLVWSSL